MVSYTTMEDELLCGAWLAVSMNFIGRSKGEAFWQQVHESFHTRKHIAPYNMYIIQQRNVSPYNMYIIQQHNMRSLSYRWYAIQTSVTKFCNMVRQL
jgi:hypothetical protein